MSSEFTLETVQQLLVELGRRLTAEGIHADVRLFGGAAVMLSGSARRTTKDIDASYAPKEAVERIPQAWLRIWTFQRTGSTITRKPSSLTVRAGFRPSWRWKVQH